MADDKLNTTEDLELQQRIAAIPTNPGPENASNSSNPVLSNSELESIFQHSNDKDKYETLPSIAETAAESLASGLTFGLSDQFLTKVLGKNPEELKKQREINPTTSALSEAAGVVAPMILTGGATAPLEEASLASKAIKGSGALVTGVSDVGNLVEKGVKSALDSAIAQSPSKKIAQEIVKKSISKGLGSAVEGAAYGTGQLIREDALGDADFNAQNLMAYAGSGALLAGTLGTAIPIASSTLSAGSDVLKELGEKASTKFLNPEEDAAKLLGFTPSQVQKITDKNPTFFSNLPDFVRNKLNLKAMDTAEDLLKKTNSLEKSAIADMDSVYTSVADKQLNRSFFVNMADKIEAKFVKPYEDLKSFRSAIRPAKNIIEDLKAQAVKEGPITAPEMREFRQKMDDLAQSFYKSKDPTKGAEAAFEARSLLKDEINSFVKRVDPELGKKLEEANRTYNYVSTIKDKLESKVLKDTGLIDFKDMIYGGVWEGAMGPKGLAIPFARKILQSDLKRKITILTAIEKSNKLVESKIASAASDYFSKVKSSFKPLSNSILSKSPLAKDDKGNEPKNKIQAFDNISKKIVDLSSEPEKFAKNISKSVYSISRAAPNTAGAIVQNSTNALIFLEEKLPKSGSDLNLPEPFAKKYKPSSMELAKFERYLQIVENPMSALDELRSGTLTKEHVEALQAVYPDVYSRIRNSVISKLSEEDTDLSYNKKLQLGNLLNIQTDESLIPKNLLALQANFGPQPQQNQAPVSSGAVKPSQTGLKNLDVASRAQTDIQQVMGRKNS